MLAASMAADDCATADRRAARSRAPLRAIFRRQADRECATVLELYYEEDCDNAAGDGFDHDTICASFVSLTKP